MQLVLKLAIMAVENLNNMFSSHHCPIFEQMHEHLINVKRDNYTTKMHSADARILRSNLRVSMVLALSSGLVQLW